MKRFLLDTSVLLADPHSIYSFENAEIIIPAMAIEEIDRFKADVSEVGSNARSVLRQIDLLRLKGDLSKGTRVETNSTLRIFFDNSPEDLIPRYMSLRRGSNIVLNHALALCKQGKISIISQDASLRIKASTLGISCSNYENLSNNKTPAPMGFYNLSCSDSDWNAIHASQDFQLEKFFDKLPHTYPNEAVLLKNQSSTQEQLLFNIDGRLQPVAAPPSSLWGLTPRNIKQQVALHNLLNPNINLVTMLGKAGTGKTLLALMAGLQQVLHTDNYSRLLISRPIFPMGKDIGYLPGTAEEKLAPWLKPIFDNLDLLMRADGGRQSHKSYQPLLDEGILQIEPLTYIRGRSIPHQFMIVDEAQNLTRHEIKTVITRVGEGTKIILTGDTSQIDNPYINEHSNGLTHVVRTLAGSPLSAHIILDKGERSELAELAANKL